MRYVIMCGGGYFGWEHPKQMTPIFGEPVVARTIRLLRDEGVGDICISTHDERFSVFGVPLLKHQNDFVAVPNGAGSWVDAFYPMDDPACYLMGDVVFSPEAIKIIVNADTKDIDFFASASPFHPAYTRTWAEPFAFKVKDQMRFREAINFCRKNESNGTFTRRPIAWELWQVIRGTAIGYIAHNYTTINDYTCDIDKPEDAQKIEQAIRSVWNEQGN